MQYEYILIEKKKITVEDLERELKAVLPPLLSDYYSMKKTILSLNKRIKILEIKKRNFNFTKSN